MAVNSTIPERLRRFLGISRVDDLASSKLSPLMLKNFTSSAILRRRTFVFMDSQMNSGRSIYLQKRCLQSSLGRLWVLTLPEMECNLKIGCHLLLFTVMLGCFLWLSILVPDLDLIKLIVFEVVSGTAKKQSTEKSSVSNNSSSKSKSNSKSAKHSKGTPAKDEEEGLDEEEEDEEHGDTLCGTCGENYASDEFWICCDICERWFHGKCVKITPAKAQHIKQYKCPSCSSNNKRARP